MRTLNNTLVTVGIPAYNAQATLHETILSVQQQTHTNLEIFVVDDGSQDRTSDIARRHADQDDRVKVIRKRNGGVASARNAALDRASGALFASVDADDIWHPDKIRLQVASLQSNDSAVLSYTWYAYIDEKSRVLSTAEPLEEGNVLRRMCRGHLVGNGSSTLIPTRPLRDIGGWDPDPRLDGNEDYKAFFTLAERGNFVVVRKHLLGYRQTRDNKSSKAKKMLGSYDQVVSEFRPRHPEYADQFAAGRMELIAYLFDRAVLSQRLNAAVYLFRQALMQDQPSAYAMLLRAPLITSRIVLPLGVRALWQQPRSGAPRKSTLFLGNRVVGDVTT